MLNPNAGPHMAAGMPAPNEGPNGTVYIASEIANGSNFNVFAGYYIHEYGNILSVKYTGSSSLLGNRAIGKQKDTDTGANFQNCVFPSSVTF